MDPADTTERRRGRRPAGEDTRGAILAAARTEFGSRGYEATTMRGIARAAAVDARLVHHYFGGKEEIFVEAMGFPVRPQELVPALLSGPRDEIGQRLAFALLAIMDSDQGRARIVAMLSGALTSDAVARMLREFLTREILGPVAAGLGADRGELRAALSASHLVGIALARVILRVEPLASMPAAEVAAIVGPVLRHYLTEPLD